MTPLAYWRRELIFSEVAPLPTKMGKSGNIFLTRLRSDVFGESPVHLPVMIRASAFAFMASVADCSIDFFLSIISECLTWMSARMATLFKPRIFLIWLISFDFEDITPYLVFTVSTKAGARKKVVGVVEQIAMDVR